MIVLIGLLRAEEHDFEHTLHTGGIRARIESELSTEEITPGDFGLALWADSRMEASWVANLVASLRRSPAGSSKIGSLASMEVAWILTGLVEAGVRVDLGPGEELLAAARALLLERRPGGHLIAHVARGPRRRLPHFADQIYSLLALSMAMIGLHNLSQATGDPSFRAAALRGLDWNYGENELGAQMLDLEAGMIYRSIRRKQRFARAGQARNAAAAYAHAKPRLAAASRLELNRTMRPYHLGWILEAWAGKEELATEIP